MYDLLKNKENLSVTSKEMPTFLVKLNENIFLWQWMSKSFASSPTVNQAYQKLKPWGVKVSVRLGPQVMCTNFKCTITQQMVVTAVFEWLRRNDVRTVVS